MLQPRKTLSELEEIKLQTELQGEVENAELPFAKWAETSLQLIDKCYRVCLFAIVILYRPSSYSSQDGTRCLTLFNLPGRFFFSNTTTSLNSDSKSLTYK